jgi:hypothetical protein
MDFSYDVSVIINSPAIVGMTKIDDIEMVTRDVTFALDDMNDEAPSIPSPSSTEMLDGDHPLSAMDTTFEFSNKNLNINYIDHHGVPYTQDKLTPHSVRFCHYELGKAKLYYNTALKAVDHDDKVKAEISSIFQTPRYQSPEAKAIIVHAPVCPIAEVLLTLYTAYHSPLSVLLLPWFDHKDLVKLIELFDWMKPLMNYSFSLWLPELSLFPTVEARHRFRIIVQAIQETPEHHPDASRFLDLMWQSTCEHCECEFTSGYFEMALQLFARPCPKYLKQHMVKITPNDRDRMIHHQHYHGAQNRIQLSTDYTMQVSILYCLKKQFMDHRNDKHGGPL